MILTESPPFSLQARMQRVAHSIHVGHVDIHRDDVEESRLALEEFIISNLTIFRRNNVRAFHLEIFAQYLAIDLVIFDHEHVLALDASVTDVSPSPSSISS